MIGCSLAQSSRSRRLSYLLLKFVSAYHGIPERLWFATDICDVPRSPRGCRVATGMGQPVTGIWLGAAAQGEGAPVPSQIADQLRGKEFRNFREFREAFWRAIGNDSELARQFDPGILDSMKRGKTPLAKERDQVGRRIKFELQHKVYISQGGEVYGIDNIGVITPKRHVETHKGSRE